VSNPVDLNRQFNNDITATHNWSASPSLTLTSAAGFRYTDSRNESVRAGASNLPPDQTLVGGATQTASSSITELRTMGWFLEERTSVNDRLYLTGGLNWDESSAFGPSERLQLFPRASLSYVMSDEPFWRNTAPASVSSLRLRAAFGETGGQPPGAYTRFQNYVNSNGLFLASFSGKPGLFSSTTIGNDKLKPERQREIEGGFDLGLLRDRAQLEFTAYHKKTTDLVLSVPLAPSSGALRQFQNIGTVRNTGVEIALNTVNVSRPEFTWRSRFTYAANRNKVLRLATRADTLIFGYLNAVIEGHPIGVFYGGIYARNPNGTIAYKDTTIGGVLYRQLPYRKRDTVTVASTGQVTTPLANRIVGDPNPKWVGSFSNSFDLPHGLNVSVLLDGQFGNDVANFTRRITEFFGSDPKTKREVTGDTLPRTFTRNPTGRIGIYEEYIEDGSFVKLREVAVSLPLGRSLARAVGARGVSLRLAGRNLYTWTDYTGLDPEINLFAENTVARGVDFANTPLPRTFVANLTFNY
jgi:outer membrane receptor protein involved in Fe transport